MQLKVNDSCVIMGHAIESFHFDAGGEKGYPCVIVRSISGENYYLKVKNAEEGKKLFTDISIMMQNAGL